MGNICNSKPADVVEPGTRDPQDRDIRPSDGPTPTPSPPQPKEASPVDFILNLTDNKPLDASDIDNLKSAKAELQKIRIFAKEFLDSIETVADDPNSSLTAPPLNVDKSVRGALYDKTDFSSFKRVSYEKTEYIRALIYDAIKSNVLFEHDTQEEILQVIDVFKLHTFKKGETVIQQGDEGSEFFVVESGSLNVHVTVKGEDGDSNGEESMVKVGDYTAGSAFGELALIFGSPRAATITATTSCNLWSIERLAYRSVISQLRYEQHLEKTAFLKTCVVSGRRFTDIFDWSQIEDLTIATKVDVYEKGEVILRQGEMGETFYIVKSGLVDMYKNGKKHGTIAEKKAFGTTSLLKGEASPVTYEASTDLTLYYLTRQDYESILGRFQDALDGNTIARSVAKSESRRSFKTSMSMNERYEFGLEDLDFFKILGRGAFGQVQLVQARKNKKVFALKKQSKHYIIKKRQKDHVLNEYSIMMMMDDPFILRMHCALQDKEHIYFLLDLMPGGELMPYLVKRIRMGKGFEEDITRFYAASVVMAFKVLHKLMIAYRDLKPENIVLNKKGYGVLVDFGLAKEVDEEGQTYTFCGTPDYLAPEIIRGTGHDWAVDYWELGIFLFEMTNGTAPFYATNQARRTRRILKGFDFVTVPSHFTGGLSDLISQLLVDEQSRRLGRTLNGIQDVTSHRWFAGFDWEKFEAQTLKAPIQPEIPKDIKTIGKKKSDKTPFPDAETAPESDWWPDLKTLAENARLEGEALRESDI